MIFIRRLEPKTEVRKPVYTWALAEDPQLADGHSGL